MGAAQQSSPEYLAQQKAWRDTNTQRRAQGLPDLPNPDAQTAKDFASQNAEFSKTPEGAAYAAKDTLLRQQNAAQASIASPPDLTDALVKKARQQALLRLTLGQDRKNSFLGGPTSN